MRSDDLLPARLPKSRAALPWHMPALPESVYSAHAHRQTRRAQGLGRAGIPRGGKRAGSQKKEIAEIWRQGGISVRVLVACEESQAICKAFREKGHESYSCDIVPCSGGHPEWHIQADALEIIKLRWDLIIAHPPCTYLSNAGAARLFDRDGFIKDKDRERKGWEAKSFFEKFLNADCPRVAVENPVPSGYWKMPKYTQIIEPYMFGDPWRKRTCLWIRGLPMLLATDIVIPEGLWTGASSCRRSDYLLKGHRSSRMRSKTFPGIAKAMAEQWG